MMKRRRKKAIVSKYALNEDVQQVFTAISKGKFRLARILIERKVNVNCTDDVGRTPLIAVCKLNNTRINHGQEDILHFVQFLLNEEETILNTTDMFGKQALDYAGENELHELIQIFDSIINMSANNCFEAVMNRWRKKALISKYTLNEDVQQVFTAISEGKFRLARILIERKFNVNCTDDVGRTPLIAVCKLNDTRINQEDR
ncbi:ANKRD50 [Mytilus coruscus]|uniref:ANKRD50 n=1 Tax=Mytilus coruscus TaxID=42192 RepID=A0A6J8DIX9_MYTCO|nr:ANKRD50 [Mytilus coruscus]